MGSGLPWGMTGYPRGGFSGLGEVPLDSRVGQDLKWDNSEGKQRFFSCSDLSHLTQVPISVILQYSELPLLCHLSLSLVFSGKGPVSWYKGTK